MAKRKYSSPSRRSNKSAKKAKTSEKGVLVAVADSRKGQDVFWEMESIVGKRIVKGKVQYKVHWKGCTSDDDTWEPVGNLCDSAYLDALEYDKTADAECPEDADKSPEKTTRVKKKVARKMASLGEKEEEKQEDALSVAFKRRQKKSSKKSVLKDQMKDHDETVVQVSPATEAPPEPVAGIVPLEKGIEATVTTNADDFQEEANPAVDGSVPTPPPSPVDELDPVAAPVEKSVEEEVLRKEDEHEPPIDNEVPIADDSPVNQADPVVAALEETMEEGTIQKQNDEKEPEVDDGIPVPNISPIEQVDPSVATSLEETAEAAVVSGKQQDNDEPAVADDAQVLLPHGSAGDESDPVAAAPPDEKTVEETVLPQDDEVEPAGGDEVPFPVI